MKDLFLAIHQNDIEKISMYLEELKKTNNIFYYEKLLLEAVNINANRIVALLLTYNTKFINAHNIYGQTLLMIATINGNGNIIKILLSAGADPYYGNQILNFEKFTPLKFACIANNYEIVKLLIEHNIDINMPDYENCTPLMSACNSKDKKYESLQICELLMSACNSKDKKYESLQICELLLNAGANVNVKNKYGNSAIICASCCYYSNFEKIKLLIQFGANVNVQDQYGDSPIIYACRCPNFEVIDLLIQSGADVNVKNAFGKTALMYASLFTNKKIVDLLLSNNAEVNISDKNGDSVLHYACKNRFNSNSVVNSILKAGAYINCVNNRGDGILTYIAPLFDIDIFNHIKNIQWKHRRYLAMFIAGLRRRQSTKLLHQSSKLRNYKNTIFYCNRFVRHITSYLGINNYSN